MLILVSKITNAMIERKIPDVFSRELSDGARQQKTGMK